MFSVKTSADFISDIRNLDERLNNLKLNSVCVDKEKQSVTYNFISDKTIDQELKDKLLDHVEKQSSNVFKTVEIAVLKIASDPELINNTIFKFLNDNYPSVSIFLKETDIRSVSVGDIIKYTLRLTKDGAEYVLRNGAIERLNEFLSRNFCSDFVGQTEIKEQTESISLKDESVYEGELQRIEIRTIKVKEVVPIDDEHMGNTASYIEDMCEGEFTVCGKITQISERMTKGEKPKPFFIIHIDDTTGHTSGLYFSKKATYDKIRLLAEGDCIITRGKVEIRDGRPSFIMDRINRCVFPSDFVKKDKYKKHAPKEYSLIFPEESSTVKITSVFDEDSSKLPSELVENDYVVFDIETTGLDVINNNVTEIGAVKIKKGKIVEQWTTLIKPDDIISEEITKLTGIDNEMVKDSPKITTVLPDFMKFIEGAVIVAHNADFDTKFMKRYASANDYLMDNKIMDTMLLSRKYLPNLKNATLKTVADHFGIVFRHHRALSDAYATAEAFIELMKIKCAND